MIAHRVDEAIDRGRGGWRSYQLFRTEHRKAFGQILMGLSSLFVIVWMLMLGHGDVSFASGFLLVMSATLLLTSVHELWTKKRQGRQTDVPQELPSSLSTKELPPSHENELPPSHEMPAASVTETTTRKLKVEAGRKTREDKLS
ncbi:MAG TPA: hypothetical protein VGC64_04350 [Pyrinomonadaceae bacterium]